MPEQGSEFTYNTMIKVASYAGNLDRALAVLEDMAVAGAAPTHAIWGSLLVACGKVCPFPYLFDSGTASCLVSEGMICCQPQ